MAPGQHARHPNPDKGIRVIDNTEVLYVRIPAVVKRKVRAYAKRNGLTLTFAARDLLTRGLQADADDRRRERETG